MAGQDARLAENSSKILAREVDGFLRWFCDYGIKAMKALGLEPTNAEIAEAVGLAPPKEPLGAEKLRGAKNVIAISDEIRRRDRWDPGKPARWRARDVAFARQLPMDAESLAEVERFVEAIRREE